MNTADLKAEVAAALDGLTVTMGDVVSDTDNARPGRTIWRHGRAFADLPTLLESAPPEVVYRYWLRIHADLTGQCVVCGQVATITDYQGRAAFWALPVTIVLIHLDGCPARFELSEAEWFDPRAFKESS